MIGRSTTEDERKRAELVRDLALTKAYQHPRTDPLLRRPVTPQERKP